MPEDRGQRGGDGCEQDVGDGHVLRVRGGGNRCQAAVSAKSSRRVGGGVGNGTCGAVGAPSTSRARAAKPPIPSARTWWMTSTTALRSPVRPLTTVTDHNG